RENHKGESDPHHRPEESRNAGRMVHVFRIGLRIRERIEEERLEINQSIQHSLDGEEAQEESRHARTGILRYRNESGGNADTSDDREEIAQSKKERQGEDECAG